MVSDGKPAPVSSLKTDFHVCQKPGPATFQVTQLKFFSLYKIQFHIFLLVRRLLQRAKTDTLFRWITKTFSFQMTEFRFFADRRLIVLPPAHLYHFYEAKIKFRVMNLGKVPMIIIIFQLDTSVESGRSKKIIFHSSKMLCRWGWRLCPGLVRNWVQPFPSMNKYMDININKYMDIYPSHGYTALVADEICKKYQAILACRSSLGTYRCM